MNLKCQTGKINIEYANYGRTDSNVCSKTTISNTDCGEKKSEEIVKSKCDEKTKCSFNASNSVFGDPCGGVTKYFLCIGV